MFILLQVTHTHVCSLVHVRTLTHIVGYLDTDLKHLLLSCLLLSFFLSPSSPLPFSLLFMFHLLLFISSPPIPSFFHCFLTSLISLLSSFSFLSLSSLLLPLLLLLPLSLLSSFLPILYLFSLSPRLLFPSLYSSCFVSSSLASLSCFFSFRKVSWKR